MNVLLIIGLVLFVGTALWMYYLFITNTVSEIKEVKAPVEPPKEISADDVMERCNKLYEQGLHTELQRFAQRELSKNFSNVELRKILAKSLMESGNEQMAVMHYEAVLNINSYDTEVQEIIAKYYKNTFCS